MRKIKVGHIGTLHDHSAGKLECIRKYPEVFEIVGIVAEDSGIKKARQKMKEYSGVKWMTENDLFASSDLDAVLVEGYELDLVNIAQRCIDRGLHIHLDKPAGDNIYAYEKLLKDAKYKNLTMQLAYMYRYNTAVQYCIDMLKSGKIGEITGIEAAMCTEHSAEKNKWLENFKGGIMFFLGCHLVDLVYMFGGVPNNIATYNKKTNLDGNNSVDNGFAVFEYDKFAATIRVNSTEVNGFGRRQLVVCGSEGTVEIKPLENPTEMTVSLKSLTNGNIYSDIKEKVIPQKMIGRYDEMMLDFARFVCGEKKNPFTYEYEFQLQKMILKACDFDIDYKERVIL